LKEDLMAKDTCDGSIADTKENIDELTASKGNSEKQVELLQKTIDEVIDKITVLTEEIEAAEQQLKSATFARKEEHAAFLEEMSANQGSMKILAKTLEVMQGVYGQGTALTQVPANQPAKFEKYEQNAQSTGIVTLLKKIITDTKESIAQAESNENEATAQYQQMMQTANQLISDKKEERTQAEQKKATNEADKVTEEGKLKATTGELETATTFLESEEKRCDFILKNFSVREKAINAEIQALKSAKVALQEDAN